MVDGFLTLLLAGEQERFESLCDLGIGIVEDKTKHVWEKEMQLAAEYPNTLDNQKSLLTTVGFGYLLDTWQQYYSVILAGTVQV